MAICNIILVFVFISELRTYFAALIMSFFNIQYATEEKKFDKIGRRMKFGELPLVIFPVVENGHWFLMVADVRKVSLS